MKLLPHSIAAEEYEIRTQMVSETILHIEENLSLMQDDLLNNIKSKYEVKYNRLQRTDLPANYFGKGEKLRANIFNEFTQLQIDLISMERQTLEQLPDVSIVTWTVPANHSILLIARNRDSVWG